MKNLPKGWTACEVSTVAEVNPRKPKAASDELVSFVGMADVSEDMRLVNHTPRPYAEVANGFTGFEDNDILVAKITPCFENGKGALVTGLTNGKGFGSTEFHVVRSEDESTRRLLYHHFSTHEFRVRGEANMTGSAGQKRIPTSFISEYVVPMPPKAEREKIVAILDACDRAIDGTAKLLEKQENRKHALVQRLLGEKSWSEVKLGQIAKSFSGGTPARSKSHYFKGNIPWIKSGEVNSRFITNTSETITEEALKESSAKMVPSESILVAMYGATAGKISISKIEAAINQAILAVIPNEGIDRDFLFYSLESRIAETLMLVQGAQPNLNAEIIRSIKIALPSADLQIKVAQVVRASEKIIHLTQEQLTLLQQQKKGLMQRLLTGQAFTH